MKLLPNLPGANQKVVAYAVARQSGPAAAVRAVIREAGYLEHWQKQALLGALDEALR